MKVQWVNHKEIDFNNIKEILSVSMKNNQMTNYGPVVKTLESFLKKQFNIENKCVIVVANGAVGLHALVSGINLYYNKNIRYATQAFTFPCSAQGPLINSRIIDIDDEMGLDLDLLNIDEIDGIIVTNLFGHVCNIDKYTEWANKNNKILLFDNATVSMTQFNGINALNFGDGSIVSLHHTKPIGYGEGGIIIADIKYESYIRKCINFGFTLDRGVLKWDKQGSNYKMSEISAAFILEYLSNKIDKIFSTHVSLYSYFLEEIKKVNNVTIFPNFSSDVPFVSCIPILFNSEITSKELYQLEVLGITARKYYLPLEDKEKSSNIYKRILCLPLHIDMNKSDIDNYIKYVQTL